MDLQLTLKCENCKNMANIRKVDPLMTCEKCHSGRLRLDNCLTVKYIKSKEFKSSSPTSWKYLFNLIPQNPKKSQNIYKEIMKSVISLNEGGTPLRISNIGTKFNLKNLKVKDETRNPTTSYMDRGTSAEISMCKWLGPSNDSKNTMTGNVVGHLAVSLAAYSARAGYNCELFVRDNQEWGISPYILYQLIVFGAKINLASKQNVFPSNYHVFNYNNTFFTEGLKSLGFEICEQLGWKLPDRIIVPLGQGTLIYALNHSINELMSLGMVENSSLKNKNVKIHGVTAERNFDRRFSQESNFISPFKNNHRNENGLVISNLQTTFSNFQKPLTTIAPELFPPGIDSYQNDAMKIIDNSGGSIIRVSDSDLMDAVSFLAQSDGIFASPAGVSSIAGLLKLIESNDIYDNEENIVCIVTMGQGTSNDVIKNWKSLNTINKIRYQNKQLRKQGYVIERNRSRISNTVFPIGNTKSRILSLLKKSPDYAYNLHKRMIEKYSISIDISTLYQHLNELEKVGAISKSKAESFRGKPIRIYYDITSSGNSLIRSN